MHWAAKKLGASVHPHDLGLPADQNPQDYLTDLQAELEHLRAQAQFLQDDRSDRISREVTRDLRKLTANYCAQVARLQSRVEEACEARDDEYCARMESSIEQLSSGGPHANITHLTIWDEKRPG
jgi:hypothetical protein